MKIVLHEAKFDSLFGVLCSVLTLSGYSHGSIIDNYGQRWDTTFKRGRFSITDSLCNEPDRKVIIIDIPDRDPGEFLALNHGRKYDAMGLILWPWRKENPDRWYCFESLDRCLAAVGVNLNLRKEISAKTILNALLSQGYRATITKGRYYDYKDKELSP